MPIYSVKDFAAHCNKTPAYINMYAKRGQIEIDVQELNGKNIRVIDSSKPLNFAFVEKCNLSSVADVDETNDHSSKKSNDEESKEGTSKKVFDKVSNQYITEIQKKKFEAELRQKELAIEKSQKEIIKIDIANKKASGEIIPVDVVFSFVPQIVNSISQSLEKEIENLISDIISISGASNEQRVKCIKRLKESISRANKLALERVNHSIDSIIDEYSNKRGRGEYDRSERS